MHYNSDFLRKLDENRIKTIYARIISLKLDETPVETIEGRVTQGSINIDGSSAVRRTCSLTIVANEFNYSDYLWGVKTKFKLEIGVQNNIDPSYPDIIWFKQGTYFISSFNMSRSTNSFTISIQGKDKMCALNGEIGGALHSSVDFGTMEEIDATGNIHIIKLPIKDIIKNIVYLYGGEPENNIIINDLGMDGLELLEYRYDIPMYIYRIQQEYKWENDSWHLVNSPMSFNFDNVTLNGKTSCWLLDSEGNEYEGITLDDLAPQQLEKLVNPLSGNEEPALICLKTFENGAPVSKFHCYIAKISYGETAGYRYTDLTYPGDLIGAIGESLTSILDKIKNMLGDFEYFYNLEGQFVFQKKKTYVNSLWTPSATNEDNQTYISDDNEIAYTFNNGELVTTFNNNPDLANLKNDFAIWGARQGISGAQIPIHIRYAIEQKPVSYKTISVDAEGVDKEILDEYNAKYNTTVSGQISQTYQSYDGNYYEQDGIIYCDWREVIYHMAQDYYKYAHILDDFEQRIISKNVNYFIGKTGYENYYLDLLGFWRELYNPALKLSAKETKENQVAELNILINNTQEAIKALQNSIHIYGQELEADNFATDAAKNETKNNLQLAEKNLKTKQDELEMYQSELTKLQNELVEYDNYYTDPQKDNVYWNKTVFEHPENLNFWFDFLDLDGELSQYTVKNIGNRPKAVNDTNIKAIYFRETPEVIFSTNAQEDLEKSGAYTCINASQAHADVMFSISSQGKSAKSMLDELLYKHSYCIETATINTIPIYYLQPNTKIRILDPETNLDSYYSVDKMSIPLTYNGTMSITATKISTNTI